MLEADQIQDIDLYMDIDDVLADKIVFNHCKLYEQLLGIELQPEEWEGIADGTYRSTFDVPTIKTVKMNDPNRFEEARGVIRTDEKLHSELLNRKDGATQAVWYLFATSNLRGYFTYRPTEIEGATKKWLGTENLEAQDVTKRHVGFPDHNRVTICASNKEKILKILADNSSQPGEEKKRKLLVDDSLPKLLDAVVEIAHEQPDLIPDLNNLIIAGFGYTQESAEAVAGSIADLPVKVTGLPSHAKSDIDQMFVHIKQIA